MYSTPADKYRVIRQRREVPPVVLLFRVSLPGARTRVGEKIWPRATSARYALRIAMALPIDFQQRLTSKTDEQLFDMLAHDVDYLPEAIAAVRVEIVSA